MSNAIINPLWIYFIEVFATIKEVGIGALSFSVVGLIIFGIFYFTSWDDEDDGLYKRAAKWCVIIAVVSTLFTTFIPSEKTMYTMFAASYITKENVELTTDALTDAVDYIFEKVDELGE